MRLRQIILLQRNVPEAAKFYVEGLGLRARVLTERWGELETGTDTTLALQCVDGEAQTTVGYSPFLSFQVEDLQETLQRSLMMGAIMDGAIQYTPTAAVAALRAPDGHMISLYQPS